MPDTRAALLRAATRLLDDGGATRVTLREVGAGAGVSHNAPYKHFADKEDLLAAIAVDELTEYSRLIGAAPTLADAADAYVTRLVAFPHRYRVVYGPWTRDHADLGHAADTAWQHLLASVETAQSTGKLRAGNTVDAANLLRATAHGAVDLELAGHLTKGGSVTDARTVVRRLTALLG